MTFACLFSRFSIVSFISAMSLCIWCTDDKPFNPIENDNPSVTIEDQQVTLGVGEPYTVIVYATDDDSIQYYYWKFSDDATVDSTTDSTYTVTFDSAGIKKLEVQAKDSYGQVSGWITVSFTIQWYLPVVTPAFSDTAVSLGDSVIVRVFAHDTNSADSALSYLWAVDSLYFSDTTKADSTLLHCVRQGTYLVFVRVIDAQGLLSIIDTIHVYSVGDTPIICTPEEGQLIGECFTPVRFEPGLNNKYFKILLDTITPPEKYLPGYENTNATSFEIQLGDEKIYYLRVIGVDDKGNEYPSAIRSFSTPKFANAYLKDVSVANGSMRQKYNPSVVTFDRMVYSYEIKPVDTTKGITITPVLDDPAAALKINNIVSASGVASREFFLGDTITVSVTSSDNINTRIYTFIVANWGSNEAQLAGLVVYGGGNALVLKPEFDPDVYVYRDTVPNTIDSLKFAPRTVHPKAVIYVLNQLVQSGATSNSVPTREGFDTSTVTVISESLTDTVRYCLITKRLAPEPSLQQLTVSPGVLQPSFYPDTLHYIDSLEFEQDSAIITLVPNDVRAVLTLNGDTVNSGKAIVIKNLFVGTNPQTIKVYSYDNSDSAIYIVDFYRKNILLLAGLEVSSGSLVPAFSSNIMVYHDTLPNGTDSIAVKAKPLDKMCKLFLIYKATMTELKPDTFSAKQYVAAGAADTLFVRVQLKTSTGVKEADYRICVTQRGSPEAGLASLSGLPADSLSFTPAFISTIYEYADTVPNRRSQITIVAVPKNPFATVTVTSLSSIPGSIPQTGNVVDLTSGGLTTITVTVTAQDPQFKKIYTIRVWREANDNAFLSSVTINRPGLTPAFSSTNYIYTFEDTVPSIIVTAVSQDTNATMRINNGTWTKKTVQSTIYLIEGNIDTVTVTANAENGITQRVYRIATFRIPSNDARLSGLYASSPNLRPVFSPHDTMYYDTVRQSIDTVSVKPFAMNSSGSSIYIDNIFALHGAWNGPFTLAKGNNAITVSVVAADNLTTKRYYVNIFRKLECDTATLSSLTTSGCLRPAFSSTTFMYRDTVDTEDTIYTVTAVTSSNKASLRINGQAIASGTTAQIKFTADTMTVRLIVTAEDPYYSMEYTIHLDKGGSARLSSLVPSAGTLTPSFDPVIVDYCDTVPFAVENMTVTPTAKDPLAGITVNGENVFSGQQSAPIPLTVGTQTVTVIVSSSTGGAQKEYRIAVTKQALNTNILLTPQSGTTLAGWSSQIFRWNVIPECTYQFNYFKIEDTTFVGGASGYSTDTMFVLNNLPGNRSFIWQVFIKDWLDRDHYTPIWVFHTPNHPPTAPGLSGPADDTYYGSAATAPLNFTWTASTGGDAGETVKYSFYIGKTAPPPLKSSGLTALTYPNQLPLDTGAYYWRVAAYDAKDTTYSLTRTFVVYDTVQLINILISPANGSAVASWTPTATWHNRSGFEYRPYYSTDSNNVTTAVGVWATDTVKTFPALNGNRTYFWRVRLRKGTNDLYSPVWKFTTPNHAPLAPTVLDKPWYDEVFGDAPYSYPFSWSGASDQDPGDVLHYNIYLSTTNPPGTLAEGNLTAIPTYLSLTGYAPGTWYWQVEVSDGTDSVKSAVNPFVLGRTMLDPDGDGNDVVTDSIYQAELDYFEYSGKAGEIIVLQMVPWKGGFDPEIKLYDAGNNLRKSVYVNNPYYNSYGHAFLTDTLPSDGTYKITCGDWGSNDVSYYQLNIVSKTIITANAPTIIYDQLWTEQVWWNQIKAYKFQGTTGDRISLRIAPQQGSLDMHIDLIAPDGAVLQSLSQDNPYYNSYNPLYLQDYQLPQTGTYIIYFHERDMDQSGSYSFQFLKLQ